VKIPIQNLYYILCYSWNKLEEGQLIDVSSIPKTDLPNLLARVLCSGTRRLFRLGIDRGYLTAQLETSSPRGQIDFNTSIKRMLPVRQELACNIDELSQDVMHNRILLTTLRYLATSMDVDASLQREASALAKSFVNVRTVKLSRSVFKTIELNRNNRFYRLLLNVCELLYECLLPEERSGGVRFKDFIRDEHAMRRVFQDFLFNFYLLRQTDYKVRSEQISWDAKGSTPEASTRLPKMITDISLTSLTRKLVIEAKFTARTFQENWGKESLRSEHLYQIYAYLKNLERRGGVNSSAEGLLIYPAVSTELLLEYQLPDHLIRVATINLNQDWMKIESELLGYAGIA